MSWWVMEQVSVNEAGTQTLANIQCDDATDLPAPNQSATLGYVIVRGSQAKVLATSENYILGSTGTWVKMEDGVKLDLTGYATEQCVDDGLADKVDTSVYSNGQAAQDAEIGVIAAMGAKNQFNIDATPTVNHTDYTLTDGVLTVTANGNWAHYSVPINLPAGSYILSTVISGYSRASGAPNTSMRLRMSATTSGGTNIVLQTVTGNGAISVPFTWTGGTLYLQFYSDYNATTYANSFAAENTMIRRAEIMNDSYAPYAPTNRELYEMILALQGG